MRRGLPAYRGWAATLEPEGEEHFVGYEESPDEDPRFMRRETAEGVEARLREIVDRGGGRVRAQGGTPPMWEKDATTLRGWSPTGCFLNTVHGLVAIFGVTFLIQGVSGDMHWSGILLGVACLALLRPLQVLDHRLAVQYLKWKQARRDALAEEIARGHSYSAPFLYLRPFDTTGRLRTFVDRADPAALLKYGQELNNHRPTTDFERLLSNAVDPVGELIGLGRPGEHLGAGRLAVPDTEWQRRVRELAKRADCIFVLPGESLSTLWELRYLVQRELLSRTILIMLPEAHGFDAGEHWNRARAAILRKLRIRLPEYSPDGAFIMLDRKRRVERVAAIPRPLDESTIRAVLFDLGKYAS